MLLVKGVEKLWDEGLVVVAAAGNQGPDPGSVYSTGCSKKIITVGSSDMLSGKRAVSGRGPTFECVLNRIWWYREKHHGMFARCRQSL